MLEIEIIDIVITNIPQIGRLTLSIPQPEPFIRWTKNVHLYNLKTPNCVCYFHRNIVVIKPTIHQGIVLDANHIRTAFKNNMTRFVINYKDCSITNFTPEFWLEKLDKPNPQNIQSSDIEKQLNAIIQHIECENYEISMTLDTLKSEVLTGFKLEIIGNHTRNSTSRIITQHMMFLHGEKTEQKIFIAGQPENWQRVENELVKMYFSTILANKTMNSDGKYQLTSEEKSLIDVFRADPIFNAHIDTKQNNFPDFKKTFLLHHMQSPNLFLRQHDQIHYHLTPDEYCDITGLTRVLKQKKKTDCIKYLHKLNKLFIKFLDLYHLNRFKIALSSSRHQHHNILMLEVVVFYRIRLIMAEILIAMARKCGEIRRTCQIGLAQSSSPVSFHAEVQRGEIIHTSSNNVFKKYFNEMLHIYLEQGEMSNYPPFNTDAIHSLSKRKEWNKYCRKSKQQHKKNSKQSLQAALSLLNDAIDQLSTKFPTESVQSLIGGEFAYDPKKKLEDDYKSNKIDHDSLIALILTLEEQMRIHPDDILYTTSYLTALNILISDFKDSNILFEMSINQTTPSPSWNKILRLKNSFLLYACNIMEKHIHSIYQEYSVQLLYSITDMLANNCCYSTSSELLAIYQSGSKILECVNDRQGKMQVNAQNLTKLTQAQIFALEHLKFVPVNTPDIYMSHSANPNIHPATSKTIRSSQHRSLGTSPETSDSYTFYSSANNRPQNQATWEMAKSLIHSNLATIAFNIYWSQTHPILKAHWRHKISFHAEQSANECCKNIVLIALRFSHFPLPYSKWFLYSRLLPSEKKSFLSTFIATKCVTKNELAWLKKELKQKTDLRQDEHLMVFLSILITYITMDTVSKPFFNEAMIVCLKIIKDLTNKEILKQHTLYHRFISEKLPEIFLDYKTQTQIDFKSLKIMVHAYTLSWHHKEFLDLYSENDNRNLSILRKIIKRKLHDKFRLPDNRINIAHVLYEAIKNLKLHYIRLIIKFQKNLVHEPVTRKKKTALMFLLRTIQKAPNFDKRKALGTINYLLECGAIVTEKCHTLARSVGITINTAEKTSKISQSDPTPNQQLQFSLSQRK